MAADEFSFPFPDSNGDRTYTDSDFAKFWSAWFANGVFVNVGSGLQVTDNGNGMNILLKNGAANINGRVYWLNTDRSFTVPVASNAQDRTDSIVIRSDLGARAINVFYKQNDTSVTRSGSIYELQVAKIFVPRNSNDVLTQNITDTRTDSNVCGIASPNNPINVDQFKAQFEAMFNTQLNNQETQFDAWLQNLKNQLDANQAGNLQNQIDAINGTLGTLGKFALDANVVHKSGVDYEEISGVKVFKDDVNIKTIRAAIDIWPSFRNYSSLDPAFVLRSGNVVSVYATISNLYNVNVGNEYEIMTIPEGFRPPHDFRTIQQGSYMNRFLLRFSASDGKVWISRYAADGRESGYNAGTWLNAFATYVIDR